MQVNTEEGAASLFRETPLHPAPSGQTLDLPPQTRLLARRRRWLFALYLLWVAAYSIRTAALQAHRDDPWALGDWLINYSGGFVRRGLPGALVMLLHRATGIPLEWVAFSIQTGTFLFFLACVYQLSRGIRWSWLMAAVMLSPATLAFTVLDYTSGFRKEVLLSGVAA